MGLVPIDWDLKTFSDVMDGFSSGQTPYRAIPEYYRGNIPWITSGELNYNVITDTIEKITEAGARAANLKIIPKGTFLFAITGLEAAGTRGSCAITGIDATTNQSCMALYPKKNLLTTHYLFQYYVRYGNELAFRYCQGTKQQSYTGAIAKKLPILIPPTIAEQTAIATALNDADALITSIEKLIAKKRSIKTGAMQELLKPKKGWVLKKLGDIAEIRKGQGLSKGDLDTGANNMCILYGELFTHYKSIIKKVKSRTNKFDGVMSKSGDILFPGSTTTTGIDLAVCSVLMLDNVLIGGDVIIVRLREHIIDSLFLTYFLNAFRKFQIAEKTKGITIHHLYGKDLLDITIEYPIIQEQVNIAAIISDMDSEIATLEMKLDKAKQIKQGMMQQLLTGKIRLI